MRTSPPSSSVVSAAASLLLVISLLYGALPQDSLAAPSAEPIKIGVILPLSGDVAAWGEDVRDSLLFANETKFSNKFQFEFEDDRCRGKEAATAASRLLNITKVNFGMAVCTESMLTAAPLFESKQTLVITPVATGAAVSQAGDYIFRTWPSDALAADKLFRFVSHRHKRIGILSEEHGYSQELRTSFLKSAQGSALETVDLSYTSGVADFKTLLLKLKNAGADSLFVNPDGPTPLHAILKQKRELHFDVPVYGVYMPGNKVFLDLAGPLAEGIVYVDGPSLEKSLNEEGRQLYSRYLARYGEPRSAPFVFAATYEALHLFDQLGAMQTEAAKKTLYSTQFSGIFGSYAFDANGDITGVTHTLKQIVSGRPQLLKE